MNEELRQALSQFVSMIVNSTQTIGEFGAQQLPEVIEQLLGYAFYKTLFSLTLWVIVFLLCMAISIFSIKTRKKESPYYAFFWDDYEEPTVVQMFAWVGIIIWFPVSIGNFFSAATQLLQITLAPKVYLIEYAASLL